MNEYFVPGSVPAQNSPGSSATIRAEFSSIASAFDKLPVLAGSAGEFVTVNATGTAMIASGFLFSDFVTLDGVQTLTNKTFAWANNTWPGFASGATKVAGTGADNVLLLAEANKLPALNGSLLTNLTPAALGVVPIVNGGTGASTVAGAKTNLGIDLKADANNAVLTGAPTCPTPPVGNSSARLANTQFVTDTVTAIGAAVPSDETPLMNGVAVPGVHSFVSRDDHVHPVDTSRAPASAGTATGTSFAPVGSISATDVQAALSELDTEKAPLASPDLTGTPTSTTPLTSDNSTRIATTAFTQSLLAQQPPGVEVSDSTPLMNGVAGPGTGVEASRYDHVHPTDTSLVALTGDQTISGIKTFGGSAQGLSWLAGSTSTAKTVIGGQSLDNSLLINTPSLSNIFASGFGVDGTYAAQESRIRLHALGVKSTGGYKSSLSFHTTLNNVEYERMVINSAGNLGIGEDAPEAKLHVRTEPTAAVTPHANGSIAAFEAGSSNGVSVIVPDGSSGLLMFGSPSSNRGAEVQWVYTSGKMTIGTRKADGVIEFMTGNGVAAATINSSGNLGIGVSPTTAKLQVSDASGSPAIAAEGKDGSTVGQDVSIRRTSSNTTVQTAPNITFSDGTANNTRLIQSGLGNLQFMAYRGGWVEDMRIDSAGNVGIGANPNYKLDVWHSSAGAKNLLRVAQSGVSNGLTVVSDGTTVTAYVSGSLLIDAPMAMGYMTGAGGTVTQATTKATAVTLNKPCGQITMNAAALAAAAEVSFVVNNSLVAATDVPMVAIQSVGTVGSYQATVSAVAAGSFTITLSNCSAGSLSQAVVLNFAILKGATS